ncbi:MAG: sigma-70 family RNA polymerase sigma factor [Ignavibacteria bacterium]
MFIFSENRHPAPIKKIESCMYDLELNIIRKIKNGEFNVFEQIVEKYKDKAMTLTMRILKNREEAEDSLQEAFIKAFRAIIEGQFEERSKFSTYFYRIVYNTALDNYKKLKTKTYNLIRMDDVSGDSGKDDISFNEMKIDRNRYGVSDIYRTDKSAMDIEIRELINEYLGKLPEKYSVILTLFYINDLSHDEISETLGLPLGTVKNRIFRAKEKLKEIITEVYSQESLMEFIYAF